MLKLCPPKDPRPARNIYIDPEPEASFGKPWTSVNCSIVSTILPDTVISQVPPKFLEDDADLDLEDPEPWSPGLPEITKAAVKLGMEPNTDQRYFYLAREYLKSYLPDKF